MSPADFSALIATTFDTLKALNAIKGGEYSPGTDKLANFREAGTRLRILPEQVLLVYFDKHYAALSNYVGDLATHKERVRSEPIDGRIDDLLLYLLLFKALLQERRQLARALSSDDQKLDWSEED